MKSTTWARRLAFLTFCLGLFALPGRQALAIDYSKYQQAMAQCQAYMAQELTNAEMFYYWHNFRCGPSNVPYSIALLGDPNTWNNQTSNLITGSFGWVGGDPYPAPGKNLASSDANMVGDPINASSGNKYLHEDDFVARAWLNFRRFYNSDGAVATTWIGSHWRHSFDRSLRITAINSVPFITVYRPDGTQLSFSKISSQWVGDSDITDRLTEADNAQGVATSYSVFNSLQRWTETYDINGLLQSIVDSTGTGVRLTYSAGLLSTVTDPYGRQLKFIYDTHKRIHQMTLPDGGSVIYAYDAYNNLISVQFPDGKLRQYIYNESALTGGANLPNAMTGLVDEAGARYADTYFDTNGRAILGRFAGNVWVTQVTYSSATSSTVQYPLGGSYTTSFTPINGVVRATSLDAPCSPQCGMSWKSRSYDGNGFPLSLIDFNNSQTTTTYARNGLLTQRIDAQGLPSQRTTLFTWDTTLRVPLTRTVQDNTGTPITVSSWTYSNTGQSTARCEVDPSIAGVTSYACGSNPNAPAGVRQWTYTYCNAVDGTQCPLLGLLLAADGPRTDVSDVATYSYYLATDESGCGTVGGACHRAGDLYQITNALGQVTTVVAYDKNGRVVRQRDASGVITDLSYHARGWLLTRTVRANADGTPSSSDAVTQITYDATGNATKVTDPDGVFVSYTYDNAHRLTDITDAVGNRIHYTLDAAGNKTQEQVFDAGGTVRRSLSRSFNTLGQLKTITDALSRTIFNAGYTDSYDANGNLVHTADGLGVQRQLGYDALNRLQNTIADYNGIDASTKNTQSVLSYDVRDNLEGVSDPDGLVTSYDRDGLNNTKALHSPDTGTTTNSYDAAGNLTQRIDARGVITNYTYDALNRLVLVSYPAHPGLNVTYYYDQSTPIPGCPSNFNVGHLTTMTDASGSTAWCYTNQGDIREVNQVINGVSYLHGYAYSLARRLVYLQYPSGLELIYGLDADGRVANINYVQQPGPFGSYTNSTPTPLITSVSYFPFGPVAGYTWAQGSQAVTRSFDSNGQLTDLTSNALNLHFQRDVLGNIMAEGATTGASPASESYRYDALYRLKELDDGTGAPEQSFTYNFTGDRLTKTLAGQAPTSYAYLSGSHQLNAVGPLSRQLDANGNTTALTTPTGALVGLGYDDRNLLTVVTQGAGTIANYQYNGLGVRVWRTITSPSVEQMAAVYDPAGTGNLYGEYPAADYREYVYLNGIPVASATDAGRGAPIITYLHADHLGTVRAATDTSGNVVYNWTWQTNAFGDQLKSGAANFYTRFPGQYYDVETGLHYNGHRYYDPGTGRYLQSDPMGVFGGQWSTYAYVGGTPLSATDPLGLSCSQSNGSLTCSYPGGPAFTLPAQPGYPSILGPGDGHDGFYHAYDVARDTGCADDSSVMQGIINNPTPGTPSPATPNGTSNNAAVPFVAPNNPVTSYLTTDLNTGAPLVVNVTGPNSAFGPGYVARTVTNGVAHTYGEGEAFIQSDQGMSGYNPLMALGNLAGNQLVWGSQMDSIIGNAKQKCGCKQ